METQEAADQLFALGHQGRLEVFRLLIKAGEKGMAAGDIARTCGVPANSMSTQLAVLARAGLIKSRREARSVIYSADVPGVTGLLTFLMEDCCEGHPELCLPPIKASACC